MRIQTTPPAAPPGKPLPPAEPRPADDYNGPADGLSHYDEKAAPRIRAGVRAVMNLVERIEVRGEENLPSSGSNMVAINHQTYFDAPTMAVASDKDIRFMAARDQFKGIVGKWMTQMGVFPVDQAHPLHAIETSITLLDQGLTVGIYPQGRLMGETDDVSGFREGAAMTALKSKQCQGITPIAIDYSHPTPGFLANLAAYGTGAAVAAAGLACASMGGPVLQTVAGVLTGAVSGAVIGGGVSAACVKEKNIKTVALGFLKGAGGGALAGAAVGGLGGYFQGGNLWLAGPLSGVTGLTAGVIGNQLVNRQKAVVLAGKSIDMAPYRAIENQKEARAKLTADLQAAVAGLKAQLVAERKGQSQ